MNHTFASTCICIYFFGVAVAGGVRFRRPILIWKLYVREGQTRKLSESSDENYDFTYSDSEFEHPFMDKKKRVQVESDKKEFIDKVYYDWLTNNEVERMSRSVFH